MIAGLLSALLACAASLIVLVLVQRRLHFELQAIFLLLTRRSELAVGLFSLLFFPGVMLHEASHWLMARLLRVRTGKVSLIPRTLPDGTLRMGYVETAQADVLRDAIIGTAPLVTGSLVTAYLAIWRLGFLSVVTLAQAGQWDSFWQAFFSLPDRPDFWLWFYLAFAVSSTMLPSPSDRRAYLPVLIVLGLLLSVTLFAGAGEWLLANLGVPMRQFLGTLTLVFGVGFAVHLALLAPAWPLRELISRVTGLRVA